MQSLYLLPEAAIALGITTDDVVNPVRYVRELIRRHDIPFIRHGRTVKLNQEQLDLLADRMIERPLTSTNLPAGIGTLGRGSFSDFMDEVIRNNSDPSRRKQKVSDKKVPALKRRARSPSTTVPAQNPLSRAAQRRKGRRSKRLAKSEP